MMRWLPGARPTRLIRGLLAMDAGGESGRASVLAYHCIQSAAEVPAKLRAEADARIEAMIPPKSLDDVYRLIERGELILEL